MNKQTILMIPAILLLLSLTGCGSKKEAEPTAPTSTTPTTSTAAPVNKPKAGGMVDTSVDAAPPGFKTGIEGGKK